MSKTKKGLHTVWHKVAKLMTAHTSGDQDNKLQLDAKIEKLSKLYPNDIFTAGCDDAYHSTSSLWFILHRDGRQFMGTTVLFISQCDSQVPTTFFLYPGHVDGVQAVLARITQTQKGG